MKQLLIILVFLISIVGHLHAQDDAPELRFDPIGGPKDGPVTVKLDAGANARIYYTLDGSSPGSGSMRYDDSKGIKVKDVAVIRAVAYVDGKRSKIVTNTYVCDREYSLPIVSVCTEPYYLFDSLNGIYVKGCCADTVEPYLGANYWKDWEREGNIEMYETNGDLCFNQLIGINIFGGYSRILPMKSIAIFARSRYGEKRIEYPIFPARDNKKYKSFILRNSGGDFLRTHLRDAFMTQLAKPTGLAIQEYRPAIVFINGRYWGIQNLREKINEHYLNQNYGVDKDNVDILRQDGVKRHGYSANYKKLIAYLRKYDLSEEKNLDSLRKFMDVDDYIRYNIAEVYSDNRDAGGNIRYWRERNDSAKWRWVFYDIDQGLGNNAPNGYQRNTLDKFTRLNHEAWPDPPWSTFIIRCLLANEGLQTQYINTTADHLNTVYHPDTALRLFNSMMDGIREEMPYHQKRWGSSVENWEHHCNTVKRFVKLRPFYLRKHIMEKFEQVTDTAFVSIKFPGEDKCKLKFNSLKIKRDFKGIYFTGVPVKITVDPKHDYEFVGWKGREEKEAELTVLLTDDLVLEPIIRPKKPSVYKDSIIINEIAYYQPEEDTSGDWIELYNRSGQTIDLSLWGFTDKNHKKRFVLPEGTELLPGEFMVLTQDQLSYAIRYNVDTVKVIGDFEFGLNSEKEHIKIYDHEGLIVDSLTYTNQFSDRDSLFSISLVHPDSSGNRLEHWEEEIPNPGGKSFAYRKFLKDEADKKYWTRIYYIGGGSFFFILVGGLLYYRYSKKVKNKTAR